MAPALPYESWWMNGMKFVVIKQGAMCLLQQETTILTKTNKLENQVTVFPQLVQVKAGEALEHNNFT